MGRLTDALRSFVLGPYSSGDPALARLFGGTPLAAGISVTEYTALNFSAVWQAVQIIAGGIASLPLILYKRRNDGGKDRFPEHPLYRLLHDEPNPEMSAMTFRETILGHALTWGNGYAEIELDNAGRPVALWPITPDRTTPYRDSGTQALLYRVQNETDTGYVTLRPDQIFHVPGLGFDGVSGDSVIRKARESVSLGLAAERFGARFFGSGALFSVALEHPAKLSEAAQQRLRASWAEQHAGIDRSHGVTVLEEGMKATKLSIPPEDAQFLESRKFQVVEIARWFNISPRKLRDIEKAASYASVEQDAIDHVTDTLRPWMVRFEQEVNRKLVSRLERRRMFAEHLVDGLLRGDIASRYQAYSVGRQWGWLSADDVRERENMNPLPDGQGQTYLAPMNMTPADQLGRVPPAAAASQAAARVVEDVVRKILFSHGERAKRAAVSAEKLRAWVHEFFTNEPEQFRMANMLAPPVAALGLADADSIARRTAARLAHQGKQDLLELLSRDPRDLRESVAALVDGWLRQRGRQVTDGLAAQALAEVR